MSLADFENLMEQTVADVKAAIKSGSLAEWVNPLMARGIAVNFSTRKPYYGLANQLWLTKAREQAGYQTHLWATFQQVKKEIKDGVLAEFKKLETSEITVTAKLLTVNVTQEHQERKKCFCTDASIAPVIGIKNSGQKWQLFGISEVHGMGNASHDKNLFGEAYDEVVPLNSIIGVAYILFRQGKLWGAIQIRDNGKLECEIKRLQSASFASEAEVLQALKLDRKKIFSL